VVTGRKNSPTIALACRKRQLKRVPGAWRYNWDTLSLGDINTVTKRVNPDRKSEVLQHSGGWALGQHPSPRKIYIAKNAQLRNDGLINERRPRHVKRNKRDTIILGTWNILTMLKPGKMHDIIEQNVNTQLQIVAIQEIQWKGYGHIRKEKYSLYYSCNPTKTGQFGSGFIVKKELVKKCFRF
jgi:hypothetical protein